MADGTVVRWIILRKMPAVKLPGGHCQIPASQVEVLLKPLEMKQRGSPLLAAITGTVARRGLRKRKF